MTKPWASGGVVVGVALMIAPVLTSGDTLYKDKTAVDRGYGRVVGSTVYWSSCSGGKETTYKKPPYWVDKGGDCGPGPMIARLVIGGKAVSVEYGIVSLKGRNSAELLDQLKPGEVWRLGSGKSTTFSTEADLSFGNATVPKGEYSLWAEKGAGGGWELVFNKQHGQWGTQHDASQDFVSAPLEKTKARESEETLTITLTKKGEGGVVTIRWGDMKLSADFKPK